MPNTANTQLYANVYRVTSPTKSYRTFFPLDAEYANTINYEGGGWECEYIGQANLANVRPLMWRDFVMEGLDYDYLAGNVPVVLRDLYYALIPRPYPTKSVIMANADLDILITYNLVTIETALFFRSDL